MAAAALAAAALLVACAWASAPPGRLPRHNPTPEPSFAVAPAGWKAADGIVRPVAPDLDPDAPAADREAIADLAAAHLGAAQVGAVSAAVRDLTSGDDLFAAGSGQALAPASTVKILTAVAALEVLGPSAALTTAARWSPTSPTSGVVTLVAGGDTTLSPDAALPGEVMGRSGMGELARATAVELRRRGVESVEVRLDDTIFAGPALLPDWQWSLGTTWGAPTTPLAVLDGRAGADADATTYLADPALAAAERFFGLLAAAGRDTSLALPTFQVTGAVTRAAGGPADEALASVESAPIQELVAHMLRASDNTLAEALGRMTAVALGLPGSFEGCAAAVGRALAELSLPTGGLRLEDCSGLSHGSAVSASTLVAALALSAGPDAGELGAVARSLPAGALQGTLAHRFNETPAAGNLRAKTGTLTGVTALAGLVQTAGGRELVFAILANPDQTIWTDSARQSVDRFAAGLAALP
jgi:D-alanyl-D-alanine carboxypeptidase/D-alanyl-D-alanine-endopeptidase (penicillin-binding protein 4)